MGRDVIWRRWFKRRAVVDPPARRTTITDASFEKSHREVEPQLTLDMVRVDYPDGWQPPELARRDPWRPRTTLR